MAWNGWKLAMVFSVSTLVFITCLPKNKGTNSMPILVLKAETLSKCSVQETKNLSTPADSSTDTENWKKRGKTQKTKQLKYHVSHVSWHMSCVSWHMSRVMCSVSPVTCHLSPVTYANSQSHRPSPCSLPHYAQDAGLKRPKTQKYFKTQKRVEVCQYHW